MACTEENHSSSQLAPVYTTLPERDRSGISSSAVPAARLVITIPVTRPYRRAVEAS